MATQEPIAKLTTEPKPMGTEDIIAGLPALSPGNVRETHDTCFGETVAPSPEEIDIMLELMMVSII